MSPLRTEWRRLKGLTGVPNALFNRDLGPQLDRIHAAAAAVAALHGRSQGNIATWRTSMQRANTALLQITGYLTVAAMTNDLGPRAAQHNYVPPGSTPQLYIATINLAAAGTPAQMAARVQAVDFLQRLSLVIYRGGVIGGVAYNRHFAEIAMARARVGPMAFA